VPVQHTHAHFSACTSSDRLREAAVELGRAGKRNAREQRGEERRL
jgi:hypothetical protein